MTSWVSSSVMHASVASLVGIAGLVLAIKRDCIIGTLSCLSGFPGRRNISEEDYTVPGLQNHGNNCFLNVILQALAACSEFQPFLEEVKEEAERSAPQERSQDLSLLPLTEALDALLEELRVLSERRSVLDPKKVMNQMSHHSPIFRMAVQQDASEAMCLLISALRKEFVDRYIPNESSLGIPGAPDCRILTEEVADEQSEKERWHKLFLGPFDGITGSLVTCQNCTSQLSLDFEFFHTLIVTPVPTHGTTIMQGCSLFDCLRQSAVAHRETRYCSCCWHAAAASYLSAAAQGEGEIEKVENCTRGDSCECKSLPGLSTFRWSNDRCRVLRRTRIVRSPKVLCMQLQRTAAIGRADAFKLMGHVAFPLVMDLSIFMMNEYGINKHRNLSIGPWLKEQEFYLRPTMFFNAMTLKMDFMPLQTKTDSCSGSDDQMIKALEKISDPNNVYRLVAVVEHFGGMDNGHYTVYRSVRTNPPEEGHPQNPDQVRVRWFRISDSEVERVSEADVLDADACMLFYERVPEGEIAKELS